MIVNVRFLDVAFKFVFVVRLVDVWSFALFLSSIVILLFCRSFFSFISEEHVPLVLYSCFPCYSFDLQLLNEE